MVPNIPWVAIVSQDAFYKPLTPEQTAQAFEQNFDFDHPSAIDQELLVKCVSDMKRSRAVHIPVYSFTNHQRTSETTYLYGHAVIVVEGIFVLQDPKLRELLDLKIFVQTDPDLMLARRIRRDIVERGRSVDGVLDQYLRFVKPSFDTFVSTTARYADIIVPGLNNSVAIEVISQHITKHLNRSRAKSIPPVIDEDEEGEEAEDEQGFGSFPKSRLLVGTTSCGKTAHAIEREPYSSPPQSTAVPNLTTISAVIPLPSNVLVVPPSPQINSLLTILHDARTKSGEFAFACRRMGTHIVETAMSLLPYSEKRITLHSGDTYTGVGLDVENICAVSILRSGAIFEPAIRRAIPALALGSMLIQSSNTSHYPLLYSVSLPRVVRDRNKAKHTWVILSDSQIGTGSVAAMAVRVLLDHGVQQHHIIMLALISSARGGLWMLQRMFPMVRIVVGGVDPGMRRVYIDNPPEMPGPPSPELPPVEAFSDSFSIPGLGDTRNNEVNEKESSSRRPVFAIIPGCGSIGNRFWGT